MATRPRAARRTPLDRVRELCLALPEAHEVEAWETPTFRVRGKIFAMYSEHATNREPARTGIWCKATLFTQDQMIHAEPDRYFRPPYVGPKGWVGAYLDGRPDWAAVEALIEDAWRLTAPKRLLK